MGGKRDRQTESEREREREIERERLRERESERERERERETDALASALTKVAFESPAISKMENSLSVAEAIFKFSHIPFAFLTFWHQVSSLLLVN